MLARPNRNLFRFSTCVEPVEDSSRHASIESQRVLERINIFKPRVIGERSLKEKIKFRARSSRRAVPKLTATK